MSELEKAVYAPMYASGQWKRKDDAPNVDMLLIGARFGFGAGVNRWGCRNGGSPSVPA